jgi:cytochrome c oxidase cbb3-type subunit 3
MSDNKTKYDQPIAGHDYDGIQEFDNPLPMWWLWTFWGTIVFAVAYYAYYELGSGPSLKDELNSDMAVIEGMKKAGAPLDTEDVNAVALDKDRAMAGVKTYKEKCAACHGDNGEGKIGPNLTDNFWINGGGMPQEIAGLIQNGILEKGMPPWKDQIKAVDINSLVAYIISIRGSAPVNAKAPEGKEYSYQK